MLVPEIVEVWKSANPTYPYNQDLDYHAALRIAYQIAKIKKWKKADILEDQKAACVESWKKISKFIMGHKWFSTMTLDSIAGDKIWQKIVAEMTIPPTNGKQSVNGLEQAREQYLKNQNQ